MVTATQKTGIALRPYQRQAVEAVLTAWQDHTAALMVMPTGTGKTITFGSILGRRLHEGRGLVLAHREELIFQAANALAGITGHRPDIEMAEYMASHSLFDRAKLIVSTIQTQLAGKAKCRMEQFDPTDFATVVVDEAHHATAASYRKVLDYYRHADMRILGVTATPDRHDEEALGQVFEVAAFDYELPDAIRDGWLVPIVTRQIVAGGLDFSGIRTTMGDLNAHELAAEMEREEVLHQIAYPTLELLGDRKALLFAASVAHAERLAEIFNRHCPGQAAWICGATPKDDRRAMMDAYRAGKVRILCNVDVATEGFDVPDIDVVVLARPTKSRAKYAQMVGRGTRPLAGVADAYHTAAERCAAIAASPKPCLCLFDFVGNTGNHQLVSAADLLGGNYSDEVVELARELLGGNAAGETDVREALERAEAEIAAKKDKHRRQELAEASQRAHLRPRVRYKANAPEDVFAMFGATPWRERGWEKGRAPTQAQARVLIDNGIDPEQTSFGQAKQLIGSIFQRRRDGLVSFKQMRLLERYGVDARSWTKDRAKYAIGRIAGAGWKPSQILLLAISQEGG